ncbi:MAG: glutamine-hydrolyzing GMP synthase [bacterium]|nr:glutamine-hydrolyzing GMP synthase [bacterium]
MNSRAKIVVLDFGGQYAHLIASRIRRLGAYSEIRACDDLDVETARREYAGIIYSGGPASVYEPGAPRCDPALVESGLPVLGICYGHQLLMQQTGGQVETSSSQEFGPAQLELLQPAGLFEGEAVGPGIAPIDATVWMSHGDEVSQLPAGFEILARTPDCAHAAVGDLKRRLFGLQFHPEVTNTARGDEYLRNFIKLCGLENTWSLDDFLEQEISRLRDTVGDKKIFFLISGGVDSTVAFALLARALPAEHLLGLFVDTGFMRDREGAEVADALRKVGVNLHVSEAGPLYFEKLDRVYDPEEKRRIIGELFLEVQGREVPALGLNAEEWYLGQGTIYPDTIESGSTKHSHKIKTHHNRVPAVEELIRLGRVVEPIRDLYKDEVRQLGRLLELPPTIVERHPFPGPGLAVRCLCLEKAPEPTAEEGAAAAALENPKASAGAANKQGGVAEPGIAGLLTRLNLTARVLPVRSVGVQGDQRSYARCAALFANHPQNSEGAIAAVRGSADAEAWSEILELARLVPNQYRSLNRMLLCTARKDGAAATAAPEAPPEIAARFPVHLSEDRIEILRKADRIVHDFQLEKKIYDDIWQFPVVLVPAGLAGGNSGESIVLRPIVSTDAMTASVYPMAPELLQELSNRILELPGCDFVFYDLTSKPPGTIEWE